MEQLREWDKQLLIFLNSHHADWLDSLMMLFTEKYFWLPLYLLLLILIVKNYKKDVWLILLVIALMITVSDQVTSTIMKPYFARLRPSHDPSLDGIIHLVNEYNNGLASLYKGGMYGFASSHAANTFATATFCWLLLRGIYKWTSLLFLWATLVTYTRVYLGVHYPGDILVGGLIGTLVAFAFFRLYIWVQLKWDSRKSAT